MFLIKGSDFSAVVFRDGTIPSYTHAASAAGPPNFGPARPAFATAESPRAPPPTPLTGGGHARSASPPAVSAGNFNKFMDNNFFAAHLKTLSEHFSKNGGNGFFDTIPFKAFIGEDMHNR